MWVLSKKKKSLKLVLEVKLKRSQFYKYFYSSILKTQTNGFFLTVVTIKYKNISEMVLYNIVEFRNIVY